MGMGFSELRSKAKAYLEAAAGTATQTAQAAENQRLHDEIEALKAQLQDIAPRRGRPPKVETEVA
jgi:cell division protein FtsB